MKKHQNEKGFTIIEVVLVLAIAALIFLMVFIALPALQRSQRDTQRKNDLSRMTTALTSYESNNRGDLPTDWNAFRTGYITTAGDTFVDPSGTAYVFKVDNAVQTIADFDATAPTIYVTTGAKCTGETTVLGQGARKVAFQMKLEGSGTACQNN